MCFQPSYKRTDRNLEIDTFAVADRQEISGVQQGKYQPPLNLPQSWGRRETFARSFTGSLARPSADSSTRSFERTLGRISLPKTGEGSGGVDIRRWFLAGPSRLGILILLLVSLSLPVRGETWGQMMYPGEIKCVVPTDRYVWIGGDNGAIRFDTETNLFLHFQEEINQRGESLALAGKIVKDIAMDAHGRVWFACWHKIAVGGGAGISVFDGVGWQTFTKEDGLAGNDTLCVSVDTMGRVWVGTTEGLSVYDKGNWTTFTTSDGLSRNDPVELYTDHLGRMWCGFWKGVNVYFRDQWWRWERESVDYVYGIVQDHENRIYCSTKGGFAVYDGEKWERFLNRGDLRKRLMSSVVVDKDGTIWCAWGGLDKGVSLFDGENWARITEDSSNGGLASNRIVKIGIDDFERVWFGARDGEVSVLIPDGAPGITRQDTKTSLFRTFQKARRYTQRTRTQPTRGLLAAAIDGLRNGNSLPFLRMPAVSSINGTHFVEWRGNGTSSKKEQPVEGLIWEKAEKETVTNQPVLIAQAEAAPAAQIQIQSPAGLMTATKEAPFAIQSVKLDIQGGVATTKEIDKIEVNGFEVNMPPGMKFGNQMMYNFSGSVMVPGITTVRIELFTGENSVFVQEFPVTVPAKEPEKVPPEIHFIDPTVPEDEVIAARSGGGQTIKIQLSVQQKGRVRGIATDDTGIKEVRVNHQTAFMQDPAPSQLDEYGLTGTEGAKYFEHSFNLDTGENLVSVEATDLFGNIAPLTMSLFVQELLSDATFYESSWALIVGIDEYTNWNPLTNAGRDARGMRDLLKTVYKFPDDHIIECYNKEATKENIFKKFVEVSKAGESDRVVIFYAGHGHTISSRKGDQGFLVPVDGAFVPVQERPTLEQIDTWISMEDLSRQLGFFQAKHVLLIVDACYSGLLTAKRGARLETVQQDQVTARYLQLAEEPAIEVITAGGKDEQVADGGYKNHSVFTGFLIRGLETGEADLTGDGVITSMELGTYVWQNVQSQTSNQQHPAYCKLPGYEEEKGTVLFAVPGTGS